MTYKWHLEDAVPHLQSKATGLDLNMFKEMLQILVTQIKKAFKLIKACRRMGLRLLLVLMGTVLIIFLETNSLSLIRITLCKYSRLLRKENS